MSIRFKRPGASPLGAAPKVKKLKGKWAPIELPAGLASDIFNGFRRSLGSSLREVYLSSQVAAPLCQADVDSVRDMMAVLVEQEVLQ